MTAVWLSADRVCPGCRASDLVHSCSQELPCASQPGQGGLQSLTHVMLCTTMNVSRSILLHPGFWWYIADMTQRFAAACYVGLFYCCTELLSSCSMCVKQTVCIRLKLYPNPSYVTYRSMCCCYHLHVLTQPRATLQIISLFLHIFPALFCLKTAIYSTILTLWLLAKSQNHCCGQLCLPYKVVCAADHITVHAHLPRPGVLGLEVVPRPLSRQV